MHSIACSRNPAQWRFIESELLIWSVTAAFARARIYADDASGTGRAAVRAALKEQLKAIALRYTTPVGDDQHVANIERLAASMSSQHARSLRAGMLRIGPMQKALNLYLKYVWCVGRIPPPPHCPVDSIILAKAGVSGVSWTQIDTVAEYQRCIDAIRRVAGERGIAQWELECWTAARA